MIDLKVSSLSMTLFAIWTIYKVTYFIIDLKLKRKNRSDYKFDLLQSAFFLLIITSTHLAFAVVITQVLLIMRYLEEVSHGKNHNIFVFAVPTSFVLLAIGAAIILQSAGTLNFGGIGGYLSAMSGLQISKSEFLIGWGVATFGLLIGVLGLSLKTSVVKTMAQKAIRQGDLIMLFVLLLVAYNTKFWSKAEWLPWWQMTVYQLGAGLLFILFILSVKKLCVPFVNELAHLPRVLHESIENMVFSNKDRERFFDKTLAQEQDGKSQEFPASTSIFLLCIVSILFFLIAFFGKG